MGQLSREDSRALFWRRAFFLLALLLGITSTRLLMASTGAEAGAAPRPVTPRGPLGEDEKATINLFERTRESVVFISTSQQVQDFWTRNVFSVPRGTGSGFIWDEAGHVVTNNHVIEGASEATVKLADGRSYKARLIGASPEHDIAVLQISTGFHKPEPVPLGSSHDLRVGQKVFAIGNPFGLDWTLTDGIISALDRSLTEDNGTTVAHLIQTDAPINPGNSGGPLLDSAGRLIGINTAIYSPSGASAGIGFSVPVDTVNRIVPQLIRQGKYIRPSLGIETDEGLNERITGMLNVEGVVVLNVPPQTAAARAGIEGMRETAAGDWMPGDIIRAVNGRSVKNVSQLLSLLDDLNVGDRVKLTLLRQGNTRDVTVQLQADEQ